MNIKNTVQYKDKSATVITRRKQQTKQEQEIELAKVHEQIRQIKANPSAPIIEPLFCTPNCQHKHGMWQDDYNKNYLDPRVERPGVPFLFEGLKNAPKACDPEKVTVAQGLGAHQTPINLDTKSDINVRFRDTAFKFNYEQVNPQETLKFNEQGDAFYYALNAGATKDEEKASYLETNTIALFDPHIEKCKLYGMQYHFHSPSEHTIDGELMDLEMHIVHGMESKIASGQQLSQFSNGVLGFLFKVMPDSYFSLTKKYDPMSDADFHDKFLASLAATEAENMELRLRNPGQILQRPKLDLTKFVQLLNFDRRWSYQGSLTTIPCAEGILWNVIEQVIPIRQSTLDKFNTFRKIEEEQFTHKGPISDPWLQEAKKEVYPINGNSVVQDGEKFMRIAVCNRKVVDGNNRAVYHIDNVQPLKFNLNEPVGVVNEMEDIPEHLREKIQDIIDYKVSEQIDDKMERFRQEMFAQFAHMNMQPQQPSYSPTREYLYTQPSPQYQPLQKSMVPYGGNSYAKFQKQQTMQPGGFQPEPYLTADQYQNQYAMPKKRVVAGEQNKMRTSMYGKSPNRQGKYVNSVGAHRKNASKDFLAE